MDISKLDQADRKIINFVADGQYFSPTRVMRAKILKLLMGGMTPEEVMDRQHGFSSSTVKSLLFEADHKGIAWAIFRGPVMSIPVGLSGFAEGLLSAKTAPEVVLQKCWAVVFSSRGYPMDVVDTLLAMPKGSTARLDSLFRQNAHNVEGVVTREERGAAFLPTREKPDITSPDPVEAARVAGEKRAATEKSLRGQILRDADRVAEEMANTTDTETVLRRNPKTTTYSEDGENVYVFLTSCTLHSMRHGGELISTGWEAVSQACRGDAKSTVSNHHPNVVSTPGRGGLLHNGHKRFVWVLCVPKGHDLILRRWASGSAGNVSGYMLFLRLLKDGNLTPIEGGNQGFNTMKATILGGSQVVNQVN